MDLDSSHRISFYEVEYMIRSVLKLKKTDLDDERLSALWKRLDNSGSGTTDAGELSRFIKLGAPGRSSAQRMKARAPAAHRKARAVPPQRMPFGHVSCACVGSPSAFHWLAVLIWLHISAALWQFLCHCCALVR